jgi:hypothetical protein
MDDRFWRKSRLRRQFEHFAFWTHGGHNALRRDVFIYIAGRSILRGLQYQLAHAVWCIEHGHVPYVRQFECGPRLVALAVSQCLIKGWLRKFWKADVCLLRHVLERPRNLDRPEIGADWMRSL